MSCDILLNACLEQTSEKAFHSYKENIWRDVFYHKIIFITITKAVSDIVIGCHPKEDENTADSSK